MENEKQKKDIGFIFQIIAIVVLVGLLMYGLGKTSGSVATTFGTVSASDIIPTGTPAVYGEELGITYDDVSPNDPRKADAAIGVLSNLDNSISLSGEDLQRYINIGYYLNDGISCEYCCGAKSIIFSDGK